jgi:hypothetical protein
MKRIDFSYNWNNKLECKAFTTLRLSDRFNVGDKIEVYLKDKKLGDAAIIDKKLFSLDSINQYVSYLDTGYSVEECQNILKRMYKNIDWKKIKIYFYLIKYERKLDINES